ncbi:hypothetical protein Ahia01_000784300 [Argonauta hians]
MAQDQNIIQTNDVRKEAEIFTGFSAWFSSSVSRTTETLWTALGGVKKSSQTADFLFSSDASYPDTDSIFSSSMYLIDSVAVIHPTYIHACTLAEDMKKVALGHYILYPKGFKEFLQSQVAYRKCHCIGKPFENRDPGDDNNNNEEEEEGVEEECQNSSVNNNEEEKKDETKKKNIEVIVIEDNEPSGTTIQTVSQKNRNPGTKSCLTSKSHHSIPIITNDVVRIEQLEKVPGPLELFIPGKNGCCIKYD